MDCADCRQHRKIENVESGWRSVGRVQAYILCTLYCVEPPLTFSVRAHTVGRCALKRTAPRKVKRHSGTVWCFSALHVCAKPDGNGTFSEEPEHEPNMALSGTWTDEWGLSSARFSAYNTEYFGRSCAQFAREDFLRSIRTGYEMAPSRNTRYVGGNNSWGVAGKPCVDYLASETQDTIKGADNKILCRALRV